MSWAHSTLNTGAEYWKHAIFARNLNTREEILIEITYRAFNDVTTECIQMALD